METQEDSQPQPPQNPPNLRKAPPRSKKKNPLSKREMANVQKKLSLLSQNLRLVPIDPSPKTLESVSAHEGLFRSLGLWDFALLPLDAAAAADLRRDLVAELIAGYDPAKRRSFVRGIRLSLSRADLGRALALPSSKNRTGAGATADFDAERFGGAEEVAAVLSRFMSDRMVFLDDAAILPAEVVAAGNLVREGRPDKVDWAGLMWALVEREMSTVLESGSCYYGAHLLCLMKLQKPRLFDEVQQEVEQEGDVEMSEAATVTVEEDGEADGEETRDVGSESCGPELSLEIGRGGRENGRNEEEKQPLSNEKDAVPLFEELSKDEQSEGGQVAGTVEQCNMAASPCEDLNKIEPDIGQCEDLREEQPEEGDKREGDEISKEGEENKGKEVDDGFADELPVAKFPTLERLTSSDFMQVMGNSNTSLFGLEQQSNGEFLGMGSDLPNKSIGMDMGPGCSFVFRNEHKRGIDDIADHVNGFHPSHQQKRSKSPQAWEQTPSVRGIDGIVEQIQHVMGKFRLDIIEKEKTYMNLQAQIQCFSQEGQQKDEIIRGLEKTRMEEMRKRESQASRYNHDLKTLSNMVFGFKKALKETKIAFDEYRKRFPMGNEPVPSDTAGIGGDTGALGLRKQSSAEEEKLHQIAGEMIDEFYKSWSDKLNEHATRVSMSATKLVKLKEEVECVRKDWLQSRTRVMVE